MSHEQLKFHSDACNGLKLLSVFYLLGGLAVMLVAADRHWALGIGACLATFAGFLALQVRAEWHWERFMDGAASELGADHPLVVRGRRL